MSKTTTDVLPLAAVLVLATLLRVWGLTWGLPSATHYFSYHPDESRVLPVAMFNMNLFAGKMLPHFYNYPSLQLSLVNFANSLAFMFGAVDIVPKDLAVWYPQWARMFLIGRCLTVAMGVGTVWATYALGRRLWGRRAGLAAALILAVTPLHAQHSHWLTVDVPATFWGVLSLLWTARLAMIAEASPGGAASPRPFRAALLAGLFAGLAAATKYNMALIVLPLLVLCLLSPPIVRGRGEVSSPSGFSSRWKLLAVGLGAAVAAFLLACPGAVLESKQFWADLHSEAIHVNNAEDPTFKDTGSGFWYHATHNLDAGQGLPLLLLSLAAIGYAAYRRGRGDGLLAAFALPYYVLIGLAAVRYARYVIPLLPILALWAGRLVADLSRVRVRQFRRLGLGVAGIVLLLTLLDALIVLRPMSNIDSRDLALQRIDALVPPPATVGFAVQPWFGAPPVSPYFCASKPGAWRRLTAPETARRIVYNGRDWDIDLLRTARPTLVVLSEYDYRDALRLHDPAALAYLALLRRDYGRYTAIPGRGREIPEYITIDGLPTHSLPHDMLYTNPEIVIFQRKQ